MKIAIIGPGALGCLLAASLGKAHQTWLLDHDPDRAARLNRQGLVLEKKGSTKKVSISASADPRDIEGANLVLLCVKSHRVTKALQTALPFFGPDTLVLALQNGIGHLAVIPTLLHGIPWALGVTAQGATLAGVGHVIHRGEGLTRIGQLPKVFAEPDSIEKKITRAAATLCSADIATEAVPNILDHVWSKLLVNTGINALTAIYNCPNGALLESAETLDLMKAAILEGKAVAEKSGVSISGDPLTTAREVCRATSANISSMLQDVRAKRPTEIAAINGALIKMAEEFDLPMPTNRKLVAKIKEIESNYDVFT
jgi:2-dehydropantoate 2-reductase